MNIESHHIGTYCRNINESLSFYTDVLGFRHLFSTIAYEGDKPLKMAWVKGGNDVVIELLEQESKATCDAAAQCLNHLAIRVDDMNEIIARLDKHGIAIEAGPFDAQCEFDRPLEDRDSHVFKVCGPRGLNQKIMFFRGPGGERIEAVQDNVSPLE